MCYHLYGLKNLEFFFKNFWGKKNNRFNFWKTLKPFHPILSPNYLLISSWFICVHQIIPCSVVGAYVFTRFFSVQKFVHIFSPDHQILLCICFSRLSDFVLYSFLYVGKVVLCYVPYCQSVCPSFLLIKCLFIAKKVYCQSLL